MRSVETVSAGVQRWEGDPYSQPGSGAGGRVEEACHGRGSLARGEGAGEGASGKSCKQQESGRVGKHGGEEEREELTMRGRAKARILGKLEEDRLRAEQAK